MTVNIVFQNKKQRMLVRQAVLKGKDPLQLLTEMEIIDQMGKIFYQMFINSYTLVPIKNKI